VQTGRQNRRLTSHVRQKASGKNLIDCWLENVKILSLLRPEAEKGIFTDMLKVMLALPTFWIV
jgi:hypothetical protein